jgi:DNA repair exonuclease SbcCD ATPase subunit
MDFRPPSLTPEAVMRMTNLHNLRDLCVGLLNQRTKLITELTFLKESLNSSESLITNQKLEIEANSVRNESLQAMIRELLSDKTRCESLERENHELSLRISQLQTLESDSDLDPRETELEKLKAEIGILRQNSSELILRNSKLESELIQSLDAIENLTQNNERLKLTAEESLHSLTLMADEKNQITQNYRELATQMRQLELDLQTNAKSDFESLKSDFSKRVSELESQLIESEERFTAQINSQQLKETILISENAEMKTKLTELLNYYERRESEPQQNDLLNEKNKTIEKLKKLVQRGRKEDERKQQQINDLQAELESKITRIPAHAAPNLLGTVARLESENRELKQRIENSQANKEMELENEKLTKMLDKSHRLYAVLVAQNQGLLAEQARRVSGEIELRIESFKGMLILPDSAKPSKMAQVRKVLTDEKKIKDTYLKRVLLQFFLQDDATRDQLIPLILDLVGCSEQHISAAQRQWQRSVHASPKASGFFGL